MEFIGTKYYDIDFWIGLFYGLLVCIPHLFIIFELVRNYLIKAVLSTFSLLFVGPMFVLANWADGYNILYTFIYVEIFFFSSLLGYFIFLYYFAVLPVRARKSVIFSNSFFSEYQERLSKAILRIFLFVAALFLFYFFYLSPEHSGFLAFLNETSSEPRFTFYSSSEFIQLSYAIFGRILVPLAIICAMSKRMLLVVVLVAISVLLHSVERQTVIILMFAYVASLFINRSKITFLDLIIFSIILSSVFSVFIMQGNLAMEQISQIASLGSEIIYQRIFVDPLYMTHHILYYYSDLPFTYGNTNRLIGMVTGEYILGFSAIGIIADGYLSIGLIGVLLSAFWWSFVLALSAKISVNNTRSLVNKFQTILLFIACVSFFYSNLFSIVPLFVILIVLLSNIYFRQKEPLS